MSLFSFCQHSLYDIFWFSINNFRLNLMCGSSHIWSVRIGVKYRNCHQTLDVYLLVAISIGQIHSKPIYKLVTYIPGPPWPIFGRQGHHSDGHISGVPPLRLLLSILFLQNPDFGGLASRGSPAYTPVQSIGTSLFSVWLNLPHPISKT